MISWGAVYRRVQPGRQFSAYFARDGKLPRETDFEVRVFNLPFENVPGSPTAGHPGPTVGPNVQTFDYGAVIVAVTASAIIPQQPDAAADYAPSYNQGGRDAFTLFMSRTDDEKITPDQPLKTATAINMLPSGFVSMSGVPAEVQAEAMLGSGFKDIFPSEGYLIAPSQGISVSCASLLDEDDFPVMTVHVAFHAMVPRVPESTVKS